MASQIKKVKKPEMKIVKNGIYYANNTDLKIRNRYGRFISGGHNVIVTSINKKKGTCKVKTITSLEVNSNGKWKFKSNHLDDVRSGNILLIPQPQLKSEHLSGVHHGTKTIKLSSLKEPTINMKYPKRYDKLIHKK